MSSVPAQDDQNTSKVIVIAVPCSTDNYAYLVHRRGYRRAVVVDPTEAEPVLQALDDNALDLVAIFDTHHHRDHVGGNKGLLERYGRVPVYGHESDRGRIPGQSVFLSHQQQFEEAELSVRVYHVPGHTLGAVAYHLDDVLFTGDTLFGGGCGRLFEGTAAVMYESLYGKLAPVSDSTRVYFGHEYTQRNLEFAMQVEPGNQALAQRLERVRALRAEGKPTTPSTMGEERSTNPFLRAMAPDVVQFAAARLGTQPSPVEVFATVRAAKDTA